jgi:hypothetical protein
LNGNSEAFNASTINKELFEGAPDLATVSETYIVVRLQVYSQLVQQYSN